MTIDAYPWEFRREVSEVTWVTWDALLEIEDQHSVLVDTYDAAYARKMAWADTPVGNRPDSPDKMNVKKKLLLL